jgi:hypothetical protein
MSYGRLIEEADNDDPCTGCPPLGTAARVTSKFRGLYYGGCLKRFTSLITLHYSYKYAWYYEGALISMACVATPATRQDVLLLLTAAGYRHQACFLEGQDILLG